VRDAAPPPDRPGGRVPRDAFSYQRLRPIRKGEEPVTLYGTKWLEPEDVTRSRIRSRRAGGHEVAYQFVVAWGEPYPLIELVSRRYPRLDFILGAAAPATDTANSWYFRDGQGDDWVMEDDERARVYHAIVRKHGAKDMDDLDADTLFDVDIEYDNKCVKLVTDYWTPARRRAARSIWKR
jgi:hypothetical protein